MCPFANSFTLTNQHQTKVGLAGSCMIMVWYKLQHCRQYKYMIHTGCFIKHTIINQSKMSRDEGYTMRRNLLNWCNLVSISKKLMLYIFGVVRIYKCLADLLQNKS